MPWVRIRHTIAACLALAALLLSGCGSAQPSEEPTPTPAPTPVKPTFTVERGAIRLETEIYGRVIPLESQVAYFNADGTVGNVYVQVGDVVEEGQLLADLEALVQLESEWAATNEQANYELALSTNALRRAEINLQIARLTLDWMKTNAASDAEIQIQTLKVELAQMDYDEVVANPATHAAGTHLKELEQAMADAQLYSPYAGVVVSAANPGRNVKKSSEAFVIGDTSQLEIGAEATDEELKQLTEGMAVTVTLEKQPDHPFRGVIRVLPYPYGSGEGGATGSANFIRITLDQTPEAGAYKMGDKVRIRVVLDQRQDVLWLPPEAIRSVGGRTFVVVQTSSGPQRVEVVLGLQTRYQVEIVSGLEEDPASGGYPTVIGP